MIASPKLEVLLPLHTPGLRVRTTGSGLSRDFSSAASHLAILQGFIAAIGVFGSVILAYREGKQLNRLQRSGFVRFGLHEIYFRHGMADL